MCCMSQTWLRLFMQVSQAGLLCRALGLFRRGTHVFVARMLLVAGY